MAANALLNCEQFSLFYAALQRRKCQSNSSACPVRQKKEWEQNETKIWQVHLYNLYPSITAWYSWTRLSISCLISLTRDSKYMEFVTNLSTIIMSHLRKIHDSAASAAFTSSGLFSPSCRPDLIDSWSKREATIILIAAECNRRAFKHMLVHYLQTCLWNI